MKVHFVRHGETDHNVHSVITSGNPGKPINALGKGQAEVSAALLSGQSVAAVYTSPLLRARNTAEIIGEACGAPVITDAELRECAVGALEGQGDAAAFARFNEALDRWFIDQELSFPLGPEGESATSAIARMNAFLRDLSARHPSSDTVVVVSHQTILQLALAFLPSNVPPSFGHRRWLTNGGISTLDLSKDKTICLAWDGREISDFEEIKA